MGNFIDLFIFYRTVDGETVHCIAVSCQGRPSVHVFYAKGITERRIWAQRILEALTPVFPAKYSAELTRAGWAYLKVILFLIFLLFIRYQCISVYLYLLILSNLVQTVLFIWIGLNINYLRNLIRFLKHKIKKPRVTN